MYSKQWEMKGSTCCTDLIWFCLHTCSTKKQVDSPHHPTMKRGVISHLWVGWVISQQWMSTFMQQWVVWRSSASYSWVKGSSEKHDWGYWPTIAQVGFNSWYWLHYHSSLMVSRTTIKNQLSGEIIWVAFRKLVHKNCATEYWLPLSFCF